MNDKDLLALSVDQQDRVRLILHVVRQMNIWLTSVQVVDGRELSLECLDVDDRQKAQNVLQPSVFNIFSSGKKVTIKLNELATVSRRLPRKVAWQPSRELEAICVNLRGAHHSLARLTADSLGITHTPGRIALELAHLYGDAKQTSTRISVITKTLDTLIVYPFTRIWQARPRVLQGLLSVMTNFYTPDIHHTHFDRSAKQFRLKVSGWQLQKMHSMHIKFDILRRATCADVARKIAMIVLQNDAHELKTKNGQVEQ